MTGLNLNVQYPTRKFQHPSADWNSVAERREFDLQDRLIDFAVRIISVVEAFPNTRAGKHIASQLVRSGTSPAPNYGEAQRAESQKDFVHKMKVALKELRETHVWLLIIERKKICSAKQLENIVSECDQLIAIFVKSLQTVSRKK
jgi:four helix bundle protein